MPLPIPEPSVGWGGDGIPIPIPDSSWGTAGRPTAVLPDVLALVRDALLAQPTLTALVGERVFDHIPSANPVWPLIIVNPVFEGEKEWHTGLSRVQLDVWGGGPTSVDLAKVREIVRVLISVSRALRGSCASGHISNSAVLNVIPMPDPETGRHRSVVDLHIESMYSE